MSNQLIPVSDAVIVRQENIATIVQAGPQSYQTNALSSQRCAEAGQQLLDEIERCGMSDDLDRRLAVFIEKTRRTVKAMNERRSPVTKLFDQVRSEFTILENSIDPTKKDTVPYRIAQYRNAYAAKKREEEERRRQAELAAQELIRAKEGYRADVEEDYRRSFNNLVTGSINELTKMNSEVNLDNYTAVFDTVTGYQSTLPADWCPPSAVRLPYNISPDEAKAIRNEVFQKLLPSFEEQFVFEVDEYRREILDKLPSKKVELERMAAADAAEAAQLKAEMAKREAEEAARKEQERQRAEAEAKQKAELDKSNAEMAGLFGMAKAEQVYTPKAKVSKKIKVNDPSAFLGIVSLWWQREGCTLSVEELAKIFKKQVTFCEKLASKESVFVENAGLEYYDDVKAQ
ncbi:hypothetical protein [Muribaculum intestinale]|jgi:hypothetical protein|uniref:hypothetical protein n=1 Tax=Muribaculum intestinale TaxID=1796646 RepID=UPI0025B50E94|nr:hypothetical protein [Muribaculum intestinale]